MSLRTMLVLFTLVVVAASALAAVTVMTVLPGWLGGEATAAVIDTAGREAVEMPPGSSLLRLGLAALLAAMLVGLPAAVLAGRIGERIDTPLAEAVAAAEAITAGDLEREVILGGRNGPGHLLAAFVAMQHTFRELVAKMSTSARRLTTIEHDTAAALARQERAVSGFSGATHEISTAASEISATSEQLLEATGTVTKIARDAAGVADEGRGGLASMTASMHQLDEAMNTFTRKLATISQRASGITSVVTTIAKVAEQTNLLSVNATIEAEKAGESGRGFRIVAQEIRRLADQTALATKDIERMVRDMQAAVAGGTMEMDRFRNEVSSRIGEVAEVSEKLGRIIEPVQSVTEALEQVHEGMEAQSEGARQIRDAMDALRGDATETASSLEIFANSLGELRSAAADLSTEAARFQG